MVIGCVFGTHRTSAAGNTCGEFSKYVTIPATDINHLPRVLFLDERAAMMKEMKTDNMMIS